MTTSKASSKAASPTAPEENQNLDRPVQSILIIDDHPIFRHGLIDLLRMAWPRASFTECGTFREGREFLLAHRWDVVMLDLTLPDGSGRDLIALQKRSPVLVLTLHCDPLIQAEALRLGASGFATKSEPPESLLEAVRTVAAGKKRFVPSRRSPEAAMEIKLSVRERGVLQQLLIGKGPQDIADSMGITHSAVQSYKSRLYEKLGVKNIPDLVRIASLHGLG